jgi:hypothetical protein
MVMQPGMRGSAGAAPLQRFSPVRWAILLSVYGTSLAGCLVTLFFLHDSIWQEAGMLVSFADGPVRRGITGSLIFAVTDLTGLDPVFLSELVLGLLTVLVFACVLIAAWRAGLSDRMLILLISPAFVVMWFTNYSAGMQKSLFVYLAFALLLFRHRWASVALFSLGVWSHEALIFLLPFFLVGLHLSEATVRQKISVTVLSGLAVLFSVIFSTADPDVLCRALTDRGGPDRLCQGAFAYMGNSLDGEIGRVRDKLADYSRWSFAAAYTLALVPVVLCLPRKWIAPAIVSGLVFLPLYVIANDWGRWVAMHIFSLTFLILLARPETLYRPLPAWAFAVLVAMCLSYGISHIGAVLGPGFVATVVDAARALL